jgi:hypothetical protein
MTTKTLTNPNGYGPPDWPLNEDLPQEAIDAGVFQHARAPKVEPTVADLESQLAEAKARESKSDSGTAPYQGG